MFHYYEGCFVCLVLLCVSAGNDIFVNYKLNINYATDSPLHPVFRICSLANIKIKAAEDNGTQKRI